MRSVLLIAFLGLVALPCLASHPNITGTVPARLMVDDRPQQRCLLVDGRRLAPVDAGAADIASRLRVFFRIGDRMERVKLTGWSDDRLRVEFPAGDWLGEPGALFVIIVKDGWVTPPFAVAVTPQPTAPPVLRSVEPPELIVGTRAAPDDFLLRIGADHLADYHLTALLIDGRPAPIEWIDIERGVLGAILPEPLRSAPGGHVLELVTRAGISAPIVVVVRPRDPAAGPPAARAREVISIPMPGAADIPLYPIGLQLRPDRFEGLRPVLPPRRG